MTLDQLLTHHRDSILTIAAGYGARDVRIFGSVLRGDQEPDSDVDVLVNLDPGRSLLDVGGLQTDLEELLGCHVDVLTENGLHWYIRRRVIEEAVPL